MKIPVVCTERGGARPGSRTLWRFIAAGASAVALAAGLSGCLLNRVVEVREQFCDFEEHFQVNFEGRPSFEMSRPVLLDSDITWLVGAAPTGIENVPNGMILTYEIEEALPQPDPARDIRVDFRFERFDGEARLSGVTLDPKFSMMLNRDFLDRQTLLKSAQNICKTGWGFGSTSLELDITDQEIEQLPDRAELQKLLGPPHALIEDGSGWIYGYRLKGSRDGGDTARFAIWFDGQGGKPVRMESSYARYRTSADFEAKKLSMNVEL